MIKLKGKAGIGTGFGNLQLINDVSNKLSVQKQRKLH